MEEVPGSNPGGPMIFQRKNKGRKANSRPTTFLTRFAEELRRAIAGEINFRRKVESRKANPSPSMLLTSPTQEELRRAPEAGPDAGRGADAEREGIPDVRMWESVKVALK